MILASHILLYQVSTRSTYDLGHLDRPRIDLGSISGPRSGTEADVHENGRSWALIPSTGAGQHIWMLFNPFPTLIISDMIRISGPSVIVPRASGDRPSGPGTLYRMYTKHNHRVGPTARRRARTLGLGTAPQSTVDSNVTRGGSGDRLACSCAVLP